MADVLTKPTALETNKNALAECPLCDGTGWVPVIRDGYRAVEKCECWKRRVDLEIHGFSKEHASAMLSDFSAQPEVATRVKALMTSEQAVGLLITGPVGTGKTRLLAALAREFILAGKSVEFTTGLHMFLRLRDSLTGNVREMESAVLNQFCEVGFLALDDLGREGKTTDYVLACLHQIISDRLGNYRATAISTNLSFAQLAEVYDQGIASRLGAYIPLALVGRDRRNAFGMDVSDADLPGSCWDEVVDTRRRDEADYKT